jgi:hypothetical protein
MPDKNSQIHNGIRVWRRGDYFRLLLIGYFEGLNSAANSQIRAATVGLEQEQMNSASTVGTLDASKIQLIANSEASTRKRKTAIDDLHDRP